MTELSVLEKTNQLNLLFDFYSQLLTEKQRTFMIRYYHDDYSLGEIASEYDISRQAVFEHIKRAQTMLVDYEQKLQLLAKHEARVKQAEQIITAMKHWDCEQSASIRHHIEQLINID